MMAVDEVGGCHPFRLVALLCVFVSLCLGAAAVFSPSWVTADNFSQSLWDSCSQTQGDWLCDPDLQRDWQLATLVLLLTGGSISLITFLVAVVLLCRGGPKRFYRIIAIMLFISVVLQVCALVLYPIKFIDSIRLTVYHEFSWGYGIGWGSSIFALGGAVLYCLNTDAYEEDYY
ncbi:transmembrane protein 47-like [Callorhinchus milii]|uniref:Transmembrane protein 47-like n=1 Tax=Callorhinchus milii TaxID=7868 RepID=A0A4W3GT69_CALMI|nr:transmembrane protein 47-like [Callorhinchus milii]|eukprot:gi/632935244/ref/XP_007889374.1/ PREDICTED: transmembrane protein 47-like [Callorhinchus milii]